MKCITQNDIIWVKVFGKMKKILEKERRRPINNSSYLLFTACMVKFREVYG